MANITNDSTFILNGLKDIASHRLKDKSALVNKLQSFDSAELHNVLKNFFSDLVQGPVPPNRTDLFDRMAEVIPLPKLAEAVKREPKEVLCAAKGMFEQAKIYLKEREGRDHPNILKWLNQALDTVVTVLENLIAAFGISDFFKPTDGSWDASYKVNMVVGISSSIATFTALAVPLLGPVVAGVVVAGAILTLTGLSLIWPWIRPVTSHLPVYCEKLTGNPKGFEAQGRKESLDQMAKILERGKHPILVGQSRVGKSLTAKAFATAIERGDYPALKGKTVFHLNATDLIQEGHYDRRNLLKLVSEEMGNNRNQIILVLDEIHMVCKHKERMADMLKTFLDEGGEFPYVIGITTHDEYQEHVVKNFSFARRFEMVEIKNTSRDETLKILCKEILSSKNPPLIEEGAVERLYDSCESQLPQPFSALNLLRKCIQRTEKAHCSPTEQKILEISNRILSLRTLEAVSRGKRIESQIAELEQDLSQQKEKLAKELEELQHLYQAKDSFDQLALEKYRAVVKISQIAQSNLNSVEENLLKKFLLQQMLSEYMESFLKDKSKELGVNLFIDRALIDEVLAT